MFRKKPSWYAAMLKALMFAGILYKVARMFMKSTDRQVKVKQPKRRTG